MLFEIEYRRISLLLTRLSRSKVLQYSSVFKLDIITLNILYKASQWILSNSSLALSRISVSLRPYRRIILSRVDINPTLPYIIIMTSIENYRYSLTRMMI